MVFNSSVCSALPRGRLGVCVREVENEDKLAGNYSSVMHFSFVSRYFLADIKRLSVVDSSVFMAGWKMLTIFRSNDRKPFDPGTCSKGHSREVPLDKHKIIFLAPKLNRLLVHD